MLRENRPTFSIEVNKYCLPLQSNFFLKSEVVLHFILQNLQAINHAIPEIENYNDRHKAFPHQYT